MEVDVQGNVYLTGWTQSTDFPLGGNAPQIQRAGDTGQDAFVVKLNPQIPGPLGLVFSTYLGGTGSDTGYAITSDQSGYIYVAGVTKSEDFPVTEKVLQRGRWGDQDGFIVWLDPNAPDPPSTVRYSSYLGGEYNDEARAVVALGPGVVAIAGETSSELYHISAGAFRSSYQGGGDIFVTVLDMKIPEYDALIYSTYLGGSGSEAPRRMVRDAAGRLILTGYTLSDDFPVTRDAWQSFPRRQGQAFLAILDVRRPGGQGLVYSTYFGASGGEVGYDIALDSEGRIYLTGYTLSPDFPVTTQAFQKDFGEGVEAFCAVLDPRRPGAAGLLYATYLGRTGINVGYGIAVAPDRTIYVAGSVQDRSFPVTENALQAAHAGGLADGFVVALKPGETGLEPHPQTINMQSP
ncbi:MAG: SBBP repeat-containing protein, partial [Bryobacteraceae bacterium]